MYQCWLVPPSSRGTFWFQFLTFLKGWVLVWFGFFFVSNMDAVPVLVFLIWGAVLVSVVFFNFKLKLVSIFSKITLSFR